MSKTASAGSVVVAHNNKSTVNLNKSHSDGSTAVNRVGSSIGSSVGSAAELARIDNLRPDEVSVSQNHVEEGVGGGDQHDPSPSDDTEVPRRVTRKTSKKMLFIWSFVSYGIICCLFFIIVIGVIIAMWFRKMRYFIREPYDAPLFDVIPNVFWILVRFLVGSLAHILLTIFTIFIMVGIRQTEKLVVRHRDKLMLWVFILACIGEYIMFVGTIDHMGSSATVENGAARETLIPHRNKLQLQKCFDIDFVGMNVSKAHVEVNLVRANLKWFVQVSCGTSNSDDGRSVPTWKYVLHKVFDDNKLTDIMCRNLKSEMMSDATSDCSVVNFLDGIVFAWLVLDGLGIWFCVGLFYLYLKAVVRTKPGRFSFLESTYQDDIEVLKHVAERVRRLTEKINNNTNEDGNGHEQPIQSRHSKKSFLPEHNEHNHTLYYKPTVINESDKPYSSSDAHKQETVKKQVTPRKEGGKLAIVPIKHKT